MASSEDLLSSEPPASESNLGQENKNKEHMSPVPDRESVVKKAFEDEPIIDDSAIYRETDHLSMLCENLKAFRESNTMCDVEINLGETKVLAHKCVLAASSKHLKSILTGDGINIPMSNINLPTQSASTFINLLDYLYTGCLSICMDNIQELIALAEKFQIEGIIPLCCKHLEESVTIENWLEVFNLALELKLDLVVKAVESYAVDYFSFMSSSNNFTDIGYEHFRSIVCACNVEDDADLEMYKIKEILKWLNHEEKRVSHIEDLIQCANLETVENVFALESFVQELTLSSVLIENPVYKEFISKLESEKHRPPKPVTEKIGSVENGQTVIEHTVSPSHPGFKSEGQLSEHDDNDDEDIADSDATYEGCDETEMHEQIVSSKPKRLLPNVNIRYTEMDNDDLYEPKNKRKSFKPKRLQLKRLKIRKGATGRPRGRPPKPRIIIERRPEKKPKMKTSCTQVLAENIEEEFQEIEREAKDREAHEAEDSAVRDSSVEDLLALDSENTIKVEPEAPEDSIKKTQIIQRLNVCSKRPKPKSHSLKKLKLSPNTWDGNYGSDTEVEDDAFAAMGETPAKKLKQKRPRAKKALTEGEMVSCPKCPRKFCTPSQLRHHMKGHGAAAPMLCEHCGFSTIHFASMNIHRRMHDVSLQYKCTWPGCDYTTIRRSRLDDHVNSHSGIKNHVCSTCGKAYAGRKHLNRHEQSHNKDKILRCDECNYESPRRDKLREHIKKHHPGTAIIRGFMHPDDLNKPKPPRPKKPKDPKEQKEPREWKPRPPRKPRPPKNQLSSSVVSSVPPGLLPLDAHSMSGMAGIQGGGAQNLGMEPVHKEETVTNDYMDMDGSRQALLHIAEESNEQPRHHSRNEPSQREITSSHVTSPGNHPPPPSRGPHHPLFQFPPHMLPATAFSEEMLQLLQSGTPGQGFMMPGQNPGVSSAANMSAAAATQGQNYVVNNANPGEQSWYVMHYPQ